MVISDKLTLADSGLEQIIEKLGEIDGVGLCRLGYSDIQRNGILGRILNALEN